MTKRTKFYQEITRADRLRSRKSLNCSSPIKLIPCSLLFNAGPLGFIRRFGRIDLTGQTECCCYSVNGSIQHPTSAACYHNTSFYTKRSNRAQCKCQGWGAAWLIEGCKSSRSGGRRRLPLAVYIVKLRLARYRIPYLERRKD